MVPATIASVGNTHADIFFVFLTADMETSGITFGHKSLHKCVDRVPFLVETQYKRLLNISKEGL